MTLDDRKLKEFQSQKEAAATIDIYDDDGEPIDDDDLPF